VSKVGPCEPVSLRLSFNECTLPFIVQGRRLHCAGPDRWARPTRACSMRDMRSSSQAPLCSPLDREVDVHIYIQDMAVCSLVCTVTAISVTQQCSRAATVGSKPSVRQRSSADPPRRCLRAHYCSARLGTPVAGHHHPRARRRDGTTRHLPVRGAQ
jgi:hypothetical protein